MTAIARRRSPGTDVSRSLPGLVDQWLAEGVITPEQAQRMLRVLPPAGSATGSARSRSAPVVVEAAGYLGGALVVVSTLLIGARYWGDLSTTARLVATGGAAAALFAAGVLVVGRGRVGARLASVLWLGSTAATAGFSTVVADAIPAWEQHAPVVVAGVTAAWATALWSRHRVLVQQVAMAVTLLATAAALIADLTASDTLPGLAVWGVAGAWLLLGWRGALTPRRAVMPLAAAAMTVGTLITLPTVWGFALAFLTLASLVALALRLRELPLLVVAALGTLLVLPTAAMEWFPDSVLAPFVLFALGVLLVGAAVWSAISNAADLANGRRAEAELSEELKECDG